MPIDDLLKRLPVDPDVERAFGRLPNELNEQGYDPWGFNPEIAKRLWSFGRRVYDYFRPTIHGVENVPAGRVLLIGNHSGQLPYDGLVVSVACLIEADPPRICRPMAERWFPTLPYVNELFMRSGVVVGDPINCRNILEADNAVLVFPEGAAGCGKVWADRYKLVRFGRGFMRLALQTNTPIVPFAVIGAEESIPSMFNASGLARLLGAPYLPVPPHLFLVGPLAYLPLPTRFQIHFGQPLHFEGPHDDEDDVIEEKVEVVRGHIRRLIDEGLAQRTSVF
jgi:1-acyl-sn-glycerol-3-phosphate acyltransferase